jgi:hypothetical protein
MFPTTATTRAAKRDHVAGEQQQLHTGKVISDCYTFPSLFLENDSNNTFWKYVGIFY